MTAKFLSRSSRATSEDESKSKSDLENIEILLQAALGESLDYLQGIETRPVSQDAESYPLLNLPTKAVGTLEALSLFRERYSSGLTASGGARSFGYVVGGTTPAALVGDWLTSAFDQDNGEGSYRSSRK